jgi:ketosteroid isomerase-like protein
MDDAAAFDVMHRFGKAYFSRDAARLEQVITPDAEWHFAFGPDAPHGRVRKGVAGFMQGIAENDALFEKLRFNEVVIKALDDEHLVMTYVLDGQYRGGAAFALRGIELVTVRDGRVAIKDVFWKQFRPA